MPTIFLGAVSACIIHVVSGEALSDPADHTEYPNISMVAIVKKKRKQNIRKN